MNERLLLRRRATGSRAGGEGHAEAWEMWDERAALWLLWGDASCARCPRREGSCMVAVLPAVGRGEECVG